MFTLASEKAEQMAEKAELIAAPFQEMMQTTGGAISKAGGAVATASCSAGTAMTGAVFTAARKAGSRGIEAVGSAKHIVNHQLSNLPCVQTHTYQNDQPQTPIAAPPETSDPPDFRTPASLSPATSQTHNQICATTSAPAKTSATAGSSCSRSPPLWRKRLRSSGLASAESSHFAEDIKMRLPAATLGSAGSRCTLHTTRDDPVPTGLQSLESQACNLSPRPETAGGTRWNRATESACQMSTAQSAHLTQVTRCLQRLSASVSAVSTSRPPQTDSMPHNSPPCHSSDTVRRGWAGIVSALGAFVGGFAVLLWEVIAGGRKNAETDEAATFETRKTRKARPRERRKAFRQRRRVHYPVVQKHVRAMRFRSTANFELHSLATVLAAPRVACACASEFGCVHVPTRWRRRILLRGDIPLQW